MKPGDVEFLNQLIGSLDDSISKLEKAYNEKNYEDFNKSKKLILQIQGKIEDATGEENGE